jgi:hypothetical protein
MQEAIVRERLNPDDGSVVWEVMEGGDVLVFTHDRQLLANLERLMGSPLRFVAEEAS